MSALVQYEPLVNEVIELFLQRTSEIYASGKVCDFALWLQYFAFDVIGQITYSKQHGFVDKHEDVDGMIAYLGRLFSYVAPVSTVPHAIPSTVSVVLKRGTPPGWPDALT